MASRSTDRKRRNGLAAFRAVESEVVAALAAGRTVLAIFEEMQAGLGMSYSQFARYVQPIRKAVRSGRSVPLAVPAPTPSATPCPSPADGHRRTPLRGRPEDASATVNRDLDRYASGVRSKKNQLL
ncbi:MAG: TraK family protein [Anaeromyxobacteraceae bacterium]